MQMANMARARQTVHVTVGGLPQGAQVLHGGTSTVLTGEDPLAENSFDDPLHVSFLPPPPLFSRSHFCPPRFLLPILCLLPATCHRCAPPPPPTHPPTHTPPWPLMVNMRICAFEISAAWYACSASASLLNQPRYPLT